MRDFIIAPSLLSADFARLGKDVSNVVAAGADWVHVDVMDNHYVPNLTLGPGVCQALRDYGITVPLDVHLMAQPVDRLISDFIAAGASSITFHPEASAHIDRSLQLIHDGGCQAGLALNPATHPDVIDYVLDKLDIVLLMAVNPGFGGQPFIPTILKKVCHVRRQIDDSGLNIRLAVDGGVGEHTIRPLAEAGADTFIAGSAIFGAADYQQAMRTLQTALNNCLS